MIKFDEHSFLMDSVLVKHDATFALFALLPHRTT